MILLQVQVSAATLDEDVSLARRFGRFYSVDTGQVQYPVTCDSHAEDVYRDEFTDTGLPVEHAQVIDLPFDYDAFVPFTEDASGTVIAELGAEPGEGWIAR